MKLAVERSRMIEWMSQVHLPREPRDTRSRSRLSVSSLLEPRVVVSPSCSSDIQLKLVLSGFPPFRYSHLLGLSGNRGEAGTTNTVPFSFFVQLSSLSPVSIHSSSTENTSIAGTCLSSFCARLWGVNSKRSDLQRTETLCSLFCDFGHCLPIFCNI